MLLNSWSCEHASCRLPAKSIGVTLQSWPRAATAGNSSQGATGGHNDCKGGQSWCCCGRSSVEVHGETCTADVTDSN